MKKIQIFIFSVLVFGLGFSQASAQQVLGDSIAVPALPPPAAGTPDASRPVDVSAPGSVTATPTKTYIGAKLVRAEGTTAIYFVNERGMRLGYPSMRVFTSYKNKLENVQVISQAELDSYPQAMYIRVNGRGAIYKLENGARRLLSSRAWTEAGADASAIMDVNQTHLSAIKSGKAIK